MKIEATTKIYTGIKYIIGDNVKYKKETKSATNNICVCKNGYCKTDKTFKDKVEEDSDRKIDSATFINYYLFFYFYIILNQYIKYLFLYFLKKYII